MSDDQSMAVPESFLLLQARSRGGRLLAPIGQIAARHEYCEDLASMLGEKARDMLHGLGIAQEDVLVRCQRGLLDPATGLSPDEAAWVLQRSAEILGWPLPSALLPKNPDSGTD